MLWLSHGTYLMVLFNQILCEQADEVPGMAFPLSFE